MKKSRINLIIINVKFERSINAQRRLTIDLPASQEALHNVLQMLLQYGLISEQKARYLEMNETAKKETSKSRWAKVAEKMSQQGYLSGNSEELLDSVREFRDDFEVQAPMEKAVK